MLDPLDMTDIKQVIGELVLQVYQRDKALAAKEAAARVEVSAREEERT